MPHVSTRGFFTTRPRMLPFSHPWLALLALLACVTPLLAQISRVTPVVEVVRKSKKSVVAIYYPEKKSAAGTGVIIHERGHIITNAHVVGALKTLTVRLSDGTEIQGTVLIVEKDHDLAIISIQMNGKLSPLRPSARSDLEVGETAIAIGNPYGYTNTVTTGIISALNRDIQEPTGVTLRGLIQCDVAINPGNSGGPLLDINGEWIGMVTCLRDGAAGIAFALNSKTVSTMYAKHFPSDK